MKICTRCKVDKPLDEFNKWARGKDGYQPACKACMNISYKASRSKKKDHYNKICNDRRLALTMKIRQWKEDWGCKFCNERFGPCLELHHIDPTTKHIDPSDAMSRSWRIFLQEAEKCVVVCANCHRKIHHGVISLGA